MAAGSYTTQLQAGLGMIEETRALLDLWHEGMSPPELEKAALEAGQFPGVAARRLHNLVTEGFAPRYLRDAAAPARLLKKLEPNFSRQEFEQLLFIFTCRASSILYDFVLEVYWPTYVSGRNTISNEEARAFVIRAHQEGKATTPWSEGTITRMGGHLTRTCADFGLLERSTKSVRQILPFRLQAWVALILAYDLHIAGLGDNSVLAHKDWGLFGMDRQDALEELKRLSLQGWLIIQSAGNVTRIDWQYKDMEALTDAIVERKLR